jgi:hypothetical protein
MFYPQDRIVAGVLLGMWERRHELTAADRQAVLAHFDAPAVDPDNSTEVVAAFRRYRSALARRRAARGES